MAGKIHFIWTQIIGEYCVNQRLTGCDAPTYPPRGPVVQLLVNYLIVDQKAGESMHIG